jgi:hypothetical protein
MHNTASFRPPHVTILRKITLVLRRIVLCAVLFCPRAPKKPYGSKTQRIKHPAINRDCVILIDNLMTDFSSEKAARHSKTAKLK